jgi:hypothetical protein
MFVSNLQHGHWDHANKRPTFPLNTDGIDPNGKNIHIYNISVENFDDVVAVKPRCERLTTMRFLFWTISLASEPYPFIGSTTHPTRAVHSGADNGTLQTSFSGQLLIHSLTPSFRCTHLYCISTVLVLYFALILYSPLYSHLYYISTVRTLQISSSGSY